MFLCKKLFKRINNGFDVFLDKMIMDLMWFCEWMSD